MYFFSYLTSVCFCLLGSLREISYEMYLQASGKGINPIPSQKICSSRYMKPLAVEENKPLQHDNSTEEILESDTEEKILEESCEEIEKQNLSVCFSSVGVSPIKLHSQSVSRKKTLGKRKMKAVVSSIQEKLAKTLNVEQNDITISKMQEDQCRDDAEKAASYDRLLNLLKEKADKASTSSEKIKLLTIAPDYWSIRAVQDFFNVAEYAVQKTRALCSEKGILSVPSKKEGKKLDENIKSIVINFYEDDKYSRILPGSKDYVSVGRNNISKSGYFQ